MHFFLNGERKRAEGYCYGNDIEGKEKIILGISVLACVIACSVLCTSYAQTIDDEYSRNLEQLSFMLNHVVSPEELNEQILSESAQSGRSKEDIVKTTVQRVQREQTFFTQPMTRAAGPIGIWDSRHNNLRVATAPGDYFVSAGNTSYGIPHGHAGIFVTNYRIVEAVGKDHNAREVDRRNSLASGKSYIYRVNTSQSNRNKAVSRAYSYRGRGYNANVVSSNRNDWGGLNCSQLVWAAYMYGAGIDLVPGSLFIAPMNLAMSPVAQLYATVNP